MSYLNTPTTSQALFKTSNIQPKGKMQLLKEESTICTNTESYKSDLINTAQKIKEKLIEAQHAIDAIGLCKLESLPVNSPLEVDLEGNKTDLEKGNIKTIHVKGGEGFINLMPQWIGNVPPSDQINVQPVPPRTLMIVGGEKLKGGETYSFSINDSTQTSNPIIITINTK